MMAVMRRQGCNFATAWEIVDCGSNSTSTNPPVAIECSPRIVNPTFEGVDQIIDKRVQVVIEVREMRLLRARNNSCKVHILGLVSDVTRKVQARHRDDTAGSFSTALSHPFHIEKINIEGEDGVSFVPSIQEKFLFIWSPKTSEKRSVRNICCHGRGRIC